MKITGKVKPLNSSVFVSDMEFGAQTTTGGIFIPGDDGKAQGIHPRWGRVWAVGPEQTDVKIGDWVLVEHGRWTRTVTVENEQGQDVEVRMVDNTAIMLAACEKPNDVYRAPT